MPQTTTLVLRSPLTIPVDQIKGHIASWESPALLEGGAALGIAGRWSILAARPRRVIESDNGTGFRWFGGSLEIESLHDALDGLTAFARQYRLGLVEDQPEPGSPPFQGGFIGYLSYDLAPRLERLPRRNSADTRFPVLRFALYDTFVVLDHQSGTAELWAADLLNEGATSLKTRRDRWRKDLDGSLPTSPTLSTLTRTTSGFSREEYVTAVRRALDYIEAGDIFQVNLSQRFVAEGANQPFELYRRLRQASPAPYSAYLAWDDLAVVSASPELFYQTSGDRISTRPIKGTRPRSTNLDEDARLAFELQSSPKDRAELTMIVDLERNDLGRVCRYGSVQVLEAWTVESFADVHHLVATVEGRLRPEVGPVDVIQALFPGGSITGAPKIRAMEIIDELEPRCRSVYTGAVGFLGRCGQSAFNIAIRTMLVENERVTYQVGGGIVADSDPEAEYLETLDKGRAIRRVLEEYGVPP